MKQKHPAIISNKEFTSWLEYFSKDDIILKLINLIADTAFYILDQEQRIIVWSSGAEKLTGINNAQVLAKPCPKDFSIRETDRRVERLLEFHTPEQKLIRVKQISQCLFTAENVFRGAICLLSGDLNSLQNEAYPAPKIIHEHIEFHGILSRSPQMQPVFQIIENAAKTEATVLVRGESGSGKELVAKAIHDLSPRYKAPFLAINCAALSASLLESELFGHVRGAFSGAIKDHDGLFQRAHGGTLFLDEVAELPLELQAKLLRVLQERNYIPVGGNNTIQVDVRIVAATHRSLREQVKKGYFREDLMYRLRVVPIFIPPLRERREDINLLLWHFIKQHNSNGLRQIKEIDPQAMQILLDYPWPGNIRELQNVLEYAFVVGRENNLKLSELPPEFREQGTDLQYSASTAKPSQETERIAIRQALQETHGKVTSAAEKLGISRATFWRKRKQYGL